jgi:aminopeptidase N
MSESTATLVRREDYAPPAYWIKTVALTLELDPLKTLVINQMQIERNPAVPAQPLRLHGQELNLARVLLNGESVSFKHEDDFLVIDNLPETPFTLEIRNTCCPEKNTQLSGLYTSQAGLFTQCEAQGFRRITYFLDRPDVMAVFIVTLRADQKAYPVLLSNGNLTQQGELPQGRHFATWHDPHPKPSYLFALVAANLVAHEQRIRTRSGQQHVLQIYVRRGDLEKTQHAMNSLIASIIWDEARFGLKLDLERFMVVAVGDFNMGAMENKGLNIFNTKYVLASPETATDGDYAGVESVIGHEYFHNWSGNRVTCRDWFQLSLKEGLTVFRDQEFSMDMAGSASASAVKRIEDVRHLRQTQFPEDAGTMAHPVRPDSYAEINNFYTTTVYEKGAEVVRMMQTLVGREGFTRGMALYFERHDGQAVTCDDFAQAIADANPGSALHTHLGQFKHWYSQAGTPTLSAKGRYDAPSRTYTLSLVQSSSPSPHQPTKKPFVIPVRVGLVSPSGQALALQLERETSSEANTERVLVLTEARQFYTFINIDAPPVPSLMRGFSAPVHLVDSLQDADLLLLVEHDADPYNRWEAAQRLSLSRMLTAIRSSPEAAPMADAAYVAAMRKLLRDPALDPGFKASAFILPSEAYIAEQLDQIDPQRIHRVRQSLRCQLASSLVADWEWALAHYAAQGPYSPDAASSGRRDLVGVALYMLCCHASSVQDAHWPEQALAHFQHATNMTERWEALSALLAAPCAQSEVALAQFYRQFQHEDLVIDKWFALQAGAPEHGGLVFARAQKLLTHPDFSLNNPNRARSLISSLCMGNPGAFHRADGAGYAFWADRILELDAVNIQMAARMARAMDRWSALAQPYRSAALQALERVAAHSTLSPNVREIINNALRVNPSAGSPDDPVAAAQ